MTHCEEWPTEGKSYLDSIRYAVNFAEELRWVEGEHHVRWVLDQVMRQLLGKEGYKQWVARLNADTEYEPWDEGIPP